MKPKTLYSKLVALINKDNEIAKLLGLFPGLESPSPKMVFTGLETLLTSLIPKVKPTVRDDLPNEYDDGEDWLEVSTPFLVVKNFVVPDSFKLEWEVSNTKRPDLIEYTFVLRRHSYRVGHVFVTVTLDANGKLMEAEAQYRHRATGLGGGWMSHQAALDNLAKTHLNHLKRKEKL